MKTPLGGMLAVWLLAAGSALTAAGTTDDPDQTAAAENCPCLSSVLRFDVSSVEQLILAPESVLADVPGFWRDDAAYRLVASWHDRIGQPPDLDRWRRSIEALRDVPPARREEAEALAAARPSSPPSPTGPNRS